MDHLYKTKMLIRPFIFVLNTSLRFTLRAILGTSAATVPAIAFFSLLFTTTQALYSSIGILPTLRVLNRIRTFILSPSALQHLNSGLRLILEATNLSRTQITYVIKSLAPLLTECLKFPAKFKKGFTIFNFFLVLSLLGPFTGFLFRTTLGLVLSSMGIVWSESLSSITMLKDISIQVLSSLESWSGLRIPGVGSISNASSASGADVSLPSGVEGKEGFLFSFLGIILLGFVLSLFGIGTIEYFYPDTFHNVPVLGSLIDLVKDIYHIFYNVFTAPEANGVRQPRVRLPNPEDLALPSTPTDIPPSQFEGGDGGLGLGYSGAAPAMSRSSSVGSADTIQAVDNSVLDTPRIQPYALLSARVIDNATQVAFNNNPADSTQALYDYIHRGANAQP